MAAIELSHDVFLPFEQRFHNRFFSESLQARLGYSRRTFGGLRWLRMVGEFCGEVKRSSGCRSCRLRSDLSFSVYVRESTTVKGRIRTLLVVKTEPVSNCLPVSSSRREMHSHTTGRHRRSLQTLSIHRPLSFMEMDTSAYLGIW